MLTTIVVAVLSGLLGSGGGLALYGKLRELKDRREESEIDRARSDRKSCEEQLAAMKATLGEMEERLALVEHHHTSYLARWIKDAVKRVTWINDRAFLSLFAPLGFNREDVIGSTFGDLLDPSAAAEIDRLDAAALAHPEVAASSMIQLHPLLPVMVVVKVAAVGREGELVYEGYAYRTNDKMLADSAGAGRQREQIEASAEHIIGRA